ncbi:MAG: dihydropteroate synthase [Gammaproteobacteria bacterium]|nr:dihydropteroate synthase [Gammaproteobacteria bacterium]MCF6229604.1 dihydropteroate synthase [Gammaproteobacteria bacterium]
MLLKLDCAGRVLDLRHPRVMGILNITPDSFSDGGDFLGYESALQHARKMVADGADMIDVGGESTRPGAVAVSEQQELDRVLPLIEALVAEVAVPISIDTSKAQVMREAVSAGAGFINDVNALRSEGALATAAALAVPVCLMHRQGPPSIMQKSPSYDNVFLEVQTFLRERVMVCEEAGIPAQRLVIDPGFGFGKTLKHNLTLFNGLQRFVDTGIPVMVGVSRKSMIGELLNAPVAERLQGGLTLATLAAWWGAAIIRTHDVKETIDTLKICRVLKGV